MTSGMGKGGGAGGGGDPLAFLLGLGGRLGLVLVCSIWLALAGLGVGVLAAEEAPAPAGPALPAGLTLVMIEEQGCGFCMRWHREVGPGYPKSDEGRSAPLVLIDRDSKEASHFRRVVFTPTFILTRDGAEVGRITGYPGADLFWWQLGDLIRKHGPGGSTRRAG